MSRNIWNPTDHYGQGAEVVREPDIYVGLQQVFDIPIPASYPYGIRELVVSSVLIEPAGNDLDALSLKEPRIFPNFSLTGECR
jgi:hypothetical protein